MKNTQIIANDAIAAGLYTAEELQNVIKTTGDLPLHTYTEWRRMGRQVKQGQRAVLICYLWKYETKHDTIHAKTDAGEDVEVNADESRYYKNKAHLFSFEQTEPAGQRPAPHVKTPAEIAAYNAMLAEQRRAAKAAKARRAAERITAALAAPGWLALPEKATGAQAPKAAPAAVTAAAPTKAKRTREQITTAAAVKRICKDAARGPYGRKEYAGVIKTPAGFLASDAFHGVLLNTDPGADVPRAAEVFTAAVAGFQEAAKSAEGAEALTLPTAAELRNMPGLYQIGAAWVNPAKLLDLVQALPGCVAYKPAGRLSPIYLTAPAGAGILLPVNRKEDRANAAKA